MAVPARTDVAARAHWPAADPARRAPGPDQGPRAVHEGDGLLAAHVEAGRGAVAFRRRVVLRLRLAFLGLLGFLVLAALLGDDHDPVVLPIVAHPERADVPRRHDGLDEREVTGRGRRRLRQPLEEPRQVLRQRVHLLLLDLERDEDATLASLEVEHALAGGTDRPGREQVGHAELEGLAAGTHRRPNPSSPPAVEFTVRTTAPSGR